MKFFIDTADVDDIRELAATGLLDGVTTNPSLIAKSGRNFIEVITEICGIVSGPVSAEVTAMEADEMIVEGRKLAAVADNVAVKLPLTMDGLKACRVLSDDGTSVNVTLCFCMLLIDDIRTIYDNYPDLGGTQILVASIRSPGHVIEAAKLGADVCTIPPSVIRQLVQHPLTDKGLEGFMKDWAKTGQSI
jgi:transaldolase